MTDLIQQLLQIPSSGIAALVNHQDKKVHLIHSINLIECIAKTIVDIQSTGSMLYKDRNKLTLVICEETDNVFNAQLVKIRKYRDIYTKKNGYSEYRPIKGVKYKLRVYADVSGRAIVMAVNRRNRGHAIGVFPDAETATNWISDTFSDPEYIIPQYANNTLTKLYLDTFDM